MSKQFLAVLAAIILLFVGVIVVSGNKSENGSGNKSSAGPTEHIYGNKDAKVTLVEYGDYQCPYCQQYYPTLKQVAETNKDKIGFQFRNFPIVSAHQNAFSAARAAEAADEQGKFWEMHDLLYETANWQVWTRSSSPTSNFNDYAKQLNMNVEKFKKDFAGKKANDAINADSAAGNKLGVTGTPTFFLNGKQIQVGNSVEAFQKVIDAELAKQEKSSAKSSSTQAEPAKTEQ